MYNSNHSLIFSAIKIPTLLVGIFIMTLSRFLASHSIIHYSNHMEGILLFYKPVDWTNKHIIGFLKKTLYVSKLGHAGTLDPFADGLMVVGIGKKYTRSLHTLLTESRKEYITTVELGSISTTLDPEGVITSTGSDVQPSLESIRHTIDTHLLGQRVQIPPVYSAKKFSGKRLCDMAMKECAPALAAERAKVVTLYEYEIISYTYPFLTVRLAVSSGYYIRTFGDSLGALLGTGGYCTHLKRTRVNNYSVDDALLPDDFDGVLEVRGTLIGDVQGVGYRYYLEELAHRYSVTGTAQNLPNKTLSFTVQGPLRNVSLFLKFVHQGPPHSRIDDYFFLIQKPHTIFSTFTVQ